MATQVELAMCTMQDHPDFFPNIHIVVAMPDFQAILADWLDWYAITMFRGTNYSTSKELPAWQAWHHIGALFYGYQSRKSLGDGLTPLLRFCRWQALVHMLAPSAPLAIQPVWKWWSELSIHITENLLTMPRSYAEVQSYFRSMIPPSTERQLLQALHAFDWQVRYTEHRPSPAQQQLAIFTSELSMLWLPHATLHRILSWIVVAWLD